MNKTSIHQLPPGTLLNKKYRIESTLGEGGFGITYKGIDNLLNIPVAIKEYFPSGYATRFSSVSVEVTLNGREYSSYFAHWKEKFLSEARTLAKFNDVKGVVNVRDFFEENGTAYIVMEFLDGKTLKKYVKENGVIPPKKMVSMLIPLINSLGLIHKHGLIHRDISPDNIMVMPDGMLKLYDFGAARDFSLQDQRSLSVMLKHGYSPQEQYRSKGKQGPWTDVYSLCATAYFCITGVVPDDSMQRVFNDEVKLPSELGASISSYLERVIMKGMSIRVENRYQTMDELLHAIASKEDNASVINSRISDATSAVVNKTNIMPSSKVMTTVMLSNETFVPVNTTTAILNNTALIANNDAAIIAGDESDLPIHGDKDHSSEPKVTTKKNNKRAFWLFISISIVLCIVIGLYFVLDRVSIAGENISRYATDLTIQFKTVTDENLQAVSDLKRLQSVTFMNSDLTGISSSLDLADCRNIDNISFINCGGNIDLFLDALPNKAGLKSLSFISTGSYSVESYYVDFKNFPNLQFLNITQSPVGIKDIDCASKLNSLVINNAGFDGFSFLRHVKSLEKLTISHCFVGDIDFIRDLPNLNEIDFSYSTIYNFSPIYDCENITNLNLEGTTVSTD